MTNFLDKLIQQKLEEYKKIHLSSLTTSDFIESTIREVAGMVCEEIIPEELPDTKKYALDNRILIRGHNMCVRSIQATAKEKGFIP